MEEYDSVLVGRFVLARFVVNQALFAIESRVVLWAKLGLRPTHTQCIKLCSNYANPAPNDNNPFHPADLSVLYVFP